MSDPAVDGPESTEPASPAAEPPATDSSTDVSSSASGISSANTDGMVDEAVEGLEEQAGSGDPELDVLAATEAERDGYLSDLQRVTAEFANFRRQAERRNAEIGALARGGLAEKLLPVLDACDLAVEHGADDVAPIRASLVQALEMAGLEVLDPDGEPFDPNRHEAVLHEPAADGDEGQVVAEVLRRGYAWEGRVLRPAMVRVRG
ncbi:MAG: nucleotide exchange factor GrpE [Acidimicrobiaceae bacterium]|nr:nucleotide exchange factor GrpE [Acidimicrobiaceae bacterium]